MKQIANRKLTYNRKLKAVLCDNLEGWMVWGVEEVKGGRNICVLLADSHGCMAEATQYYRAIILKKRI